MPVFALNSLIAALEEKGFSCRAGTLELDVHPMRRPYYERWLSHRDGFARVMTGNVDYVGVEDVVRMGPFFNIYCLVENDFVFELDDNAHNLLDATPYFQLHNGKAVRMGWSGGVISNILAKDSDLSAEFAKNIMKEEVKKLEVKAANYACVIQTQVWEPAGLASIFGIIDRIALDVRKLVKSIHLGEKVDV